MQGAGVFPRRSFQQGRNWAIIRRGATQIWYQLAPEQVVDGLKVGFDPFRCSSASSWLVPFSDCCRVFDLNAVGHALNDQAVVVVPERDLN